MTLLKVGSVRISLFIPCYVDQFFPEVGVSVVEVLERLGHLVEYPAGQTCCGQPAFNGGYPDEARATAEHMLDVFSGADAIVVPSGSCAAMVRVFYPKLFEGHALAGEAERLGKRTFEFSEFLVDQLGVADLGAVLPHSVTFHDGCHGLRELGISKQPRALLANVRGLELVEMDEAESCCGFGGSFSVKFPQISTAMAQTKCDSVLRTEADYVVSGDPSCLMQLRGLAERQGLDVRFLHLAQVLNHTGETDRPDSE